MTMTNVRKFHWTAFFGNWAFATGILIFHYRELGFTFIQIFLLAAIYEGLNFILEIPTGILADIWGYRKTVILGCLISALSFFVVLVNSEIYASYLIWAVLSAICTTLNSGTYDAFIYESVQSENRSNYEKILGSIRFISFSTQAACIILGGLFSDWIGFNLALLLSGIGGLLQTAILVSMNEIKTDEQRIDNLPSDIKKRVSIIVKTSIEEIGKSFLFQKFLFLGVLMFLAMQFANTIYQPYLERMGIHTNLLIALCSAASMFIMAVGAKIAGRFTHEFVSKEQIVFNLVFAISVPFLFLYSIALGMAAFCFLFLIFGISEVMYMSIVNQSIPSDIRATILSFQNQLFSIIYSFAAVGLGILLEKTSIPFASSVFASILILLILLNSFFGKIRNNN